MAIKDGSYYELPASELARWLDQQGADRWWTVDGDPLLGGLLALPGPGDELAAVLRRINKPLLLADKDNAPEARGQMVRAADLNQLADTLPHYGDAGPGGDRAFYLSWKGSEFDWLLIEDVLTSESEAREARSQEEVR
jgi:hypothetical protein